MSKFFGYLTYEFISSHANIFWSDIYFGLKNEYILPSVSLEHGIKLIKSNIFIPGDLVELFSCEEKEIIYVVYDLSDLEGSYCNDLISSKWLFLILYWVYNNREKYDDPLGIVELIYSDFDYPQSMESFVRYMPIVDSYDLGSKEQNEKRLYDKWFQFLQSWKAKDFE